MFLKWWTIRGEEDKMHKEDMLTNARFSEEWAGKSMDEGFVFNQC